MPRPRSAGLLLVRPRPGGPEVLLVHPGGPVWAKRDAGAWSVPKGEIGTGEEPLDAARREFAEELGQPAPDGATEPLGEIRQRAGKVVVGFAVAGDLDASAVRSNTTTIEWPPRSGRRLTIPEIDRAEWFGLDEAAARLNEAQRPFLDRLAGRIAAGAWPP